MTNTFPCFYNIGAAFDSIFEYQQFLSDELVKDPNNIQVRFTPAYADNNMVGAVTSLSIGILNKTEKSKKDFLGVAGVDMDIILLDKLIPNSELGVLGHRFSVNNNGLFLTHSKLVFDKELDFTDVMLEDIEYTVNRSDAVDIKMQMIKRASGCRVITAHRLFGKVQIKNITTTKRMTTMDFEYCYQPINGTPFSLGISMMVSGLYVLRINDSEDAFSRYCNVNCKSEGITRYCTFTKSSFGDNEGVKDCVCRKNANTSSLVDCLINQFILNNWDKEKFSSYIEVTGLYLLSSFGIVYSASLADKKAFLSSFECKDCIFSDEAYIHPSSFNGSYSLQEFLTVSMQTRHERKHDFEPTQNISISTTLKLNNLNVAAVVGVIGINITEGGLNSVLIDSAKNNGIDCGDEKYQCRLIDENGYIIASSQDHRESGKFLGMVDGEMFEEFLNLSMYEKFQFKDSQAVCAVENDTSKVSSAVSLTNTFQYLLNLIWLVMHQFNTVVTHEIKTHEQCVKVVTVYQRTNKTIQNGTILYHNNCAQKYFVSPLHDTNIDLVVANCDDMCDCISKKSIEISFNREYPKCVVNKYDRQRLIQNCHIENNMQPPSGAVVHHLTISTVLLWVVLVFISN